MNDINIGMCVIKDLLLGGGKDMRECKCVKLAAHYASYI
jgi:hypothetical protein